jgi:hypothetical protein
MSSWTVHRARVAALSRDREPHDPDLLAARRELTAAMLEQQVERAMAADPPLLPEQLDRIANLLRSPRLPVAS